MQIQDRGGFGPFVHAYSFSKIVCIGSRSIIQIRQVVRFPFADKVARLKASEDLEGLLKAREEANVVRDMLSRRIHWDRSRNTIDLSKVLSLVKKQLGSNELPEQVELEVMDQKPDEQPLLPQVKVGTISEKDKKAADKEMNKALAEVDKIIEDLDKAIARVRAKQEEQKPPVEEESVERPSSPIPGEAPRSKEKTKYVGREPSKKESADQRRTRERQILLEDQKREDTARVRKEEKAQLKKKIEKQEHRVEERKADEKRHEDRKEERKHKV